MTDPKDRFDALLDAMVNKPPLTVEPSEPSPDDETDLREDDD